ncbi:MAG: baseplate J/gp47 family protein [Peptostreptococcaceae bacterium]|nr:baseplate J/gp47 family protein [Peptostreptococcaceae bacterium]
MFENQTYEAIKQRILDNINTDIDKREGSFTQNLISPISQELAKFYTEQEGLVNMAFVRNGFFNYLDDKCWEYGINRKIGTNAAGEVIFEGEDNTSISNGTVIYHNDLYYVVLNDAYIKNGKAELIVEAYEMGKRYNVIKNTEFTLREDIEGVAKVYAKDDFKGGSDTETDEELRDRYFDTIKKSFTSGNVAHYEAWTQEVNGVGLCKVYPLKNGNGTVEIVITDSNMLGASSELIESVKANIEEKRPIGANISIVSATEKTINITANITLASGYTVEEVKAEFTEKVVEYLKDISFKTSYISNARLGNLLLDTNGVFDYTEFKINDLTSNIALNDIEVPKLGTVEFTVV